MPMFLQELEKTLEAMLGFLLLVPASPGLCSLEDGCQELFVCTIARGGDNYLLCCCLLLLSCCISKFHVFSVQNFSVTNVKESKSGLNYLVRPLYSTSFFSLPFPLTACQNYKCQLSVKYFQRFSRNKSGAMYLIVPVAAVRNSVAARRIQFSKSEIRNFRNEILSKKNVVWLDVKMQNLHFTAPMKIFNPTSHLKRNLIHFLPTQKGISFSR